MRQHFKGQLVIVFMTIGTLLSMGHKPAISKEKSLIKSTIEMYFDGWMTGDTTKIGQVMHKTCKLKLIKEEDLIEISRSSYLGNFSPKLPIEGAFGRILSVDITNGVIASAKCELEIPGRIYTDYFNLMKIRDSWVIVDKISTNKSK